MAVIYENVSVVNKSTFKDLKVGEFFLEEGNDDIVYVKTNKIMLNNSIPTSVNALILNFKSEPENVGTFVCFNNDEEVREVNANVQYSINYGRERD